MYPELQAGLWGEVQWQVGEEHSAQAMQSGTLDVFATPALLALMEAAACRAVHLHLPAGIATVGIEAHIEHLAASLIGERVVARAELSAVEGRRLTFTIQAWDEQDLIGRATHVRYVIDEQRFLDRLSKPSPPSP